MKPISIVITINLALLAIFGLFFTVLVNRPEMIPFATSFQAVLNFLGAGIMYVDRKKDMSTAFLIGAAGTVALTIVGYILLAKYSGQIGVEERYTTMLNEFDFISNYFRNYL